jgi:hypothetical protein
MKNLFMIFLGLMFISTGTNAQQDENRFKFSVSWSPLRYNDVVSENSTVSDFSILGASVSGEYSISPRLSIITGFQYNTWKKPKAILVPNEPNIGDYYTVTLSRISTVPIGVNYILTNPANKFAIYSNVGLKYARVIQSRSYSPNEDGLVGNGYGPKNILLTNFGVGASYKFRNRLYPYANINYGNSIAGDNLGISTVGSELGLKISF